MKKSIVLFLLLFGISILVGCEGASEAEVGERINKTLSTIKGDDSVILHFDVEYDGEKQEYDIFQEYDIYINKTKNYASLQMPYIDQPSLRDYRYMFFNEEGNPKSYYEYNYSEQSFGPSGSVEGKENYIFDKLSFGQYDIPKLTISIENIIDMINTESVSLQTVTSSDPDLQDYILYEATFKLGYFIQHNETVLTGLYGDKINRNDLSNLQVVEQKMLFGYDQVTDEISYVSYNQQSVLDVLNGDYNEIKVEIFIEAVSEEAEAEMTELENSAYFPELEKELPKEETDQQNDEDNRAGEEETTDQQTN